MFDVEFDQAGAAWLGLVVFGTLGSQVVVLNNSGTLIGSQLYGPYGNPRYSSGTLPTSIGFTGQQADSVTGLDYFNARYYDPVTGQFLSADMVQGNAQGTSPYTYVAGNPESRTDPTGQKPVGCQPGTQGCSPTGVPTGGGGSSGGGSNPCELSGGNPEYCGGGGVGGGTHHGGGGSGGSGGGGKLGAHPPTGKEGSSDSSCTGPCAARAAALTAEQDFSGMQAQFQSIVDWLNHLAIIIGIISGGFDIGAFFTDGVAAIPGISLGVVSAILATGGALFQELVNSTGAMEAQFSALSGMGDDFWGDAQNVNSWFGNARAQAQKGMPVLSRIESWWNSNKGVMQSVNSMGIFHNDTAMNTIAGISSLPQQVESEIDSTESAVYNALYPPLNIQQQR